MAASPLSPAEAFVLLDPRQSSAREAFKITLLAMIAQGALKMSETERPGLFRNTKTVFIRTIDLPPDAPGHVESVFDVIQQASKLGRGAEMPDIGRVARQALGSGLTNFKKNLLFPALCSRGLLKAENDRVLWLFNRVVHEHTPAGLIERNRVEATLARARRLPALLDSNPAEAAAIALAAGGLLLLLPELKSYYGRLATLRAAGDAGSSSDGGGGEGGWNATDAFPLSGFDFGSFDSHAFSALDLDFGSFDSSFDSSVGDGGGGDGGGGDGGGGGGD